MAQAISLASAPINSRIYTPADYGALAAYMSVSGLLTTAATLLYHHPVVLTENDDDARDLVGTCIASSAALAFVALIGAAAFGRSVAEHFHLPELRWWFFGIPAGTLGAGVMVSCSAWVNRKRGYRALASTRIFTALLPIPATIGLGIYVAGPFGLLVGLLLSQVGAAVSSALVARRLGLRLSAVRPARMLELASIYRKFPLFSLPADLISSLTSSLPIYLLVAFAGPSAAGGYAMSSRLLGIPSVLIGNSIGEVFKQQAVADCAKSGECRAIFRKTGKHMAAIAIPGFLVIGFAGPTLFSVVLGSHWRAAGGVAQILAPLFCLQFVVSPLTVLYYLRNRLREDLVLHVALVAVIAASMYVAHLVTNSVAVLLAAYVFGYGSIYLVYWVRSYQLAGPQSQV